MFIAQAQFICVRFVANVGAYCVRKCTKQVFIYNLEDAVNLLWTAIMFYQFH